MKGGLRDLKALGAKPRERTAAEAGAAGELDKTRVLVVDDEPEVVRVFDLMIKTAFPGVTVERAYNGTQALAAFRQRRHAVLILDINLGTVTGENVYRQLQTWCAAHGMEAPKVIFCTGYTPSPLLRRLVEPGADNRLMLKPVGTEQVVDTLTDVLASVLGHTPETALHPSWAVA